MRYITKILISIICLSSNSFAELPLYKYNPPGSVDTDIFSDVWSRCSPTERQMGYSQQDGKVTGSHELTHQINAKLRNMYRQNKFGLYLNKGHCWILDNPKVTLKDVSVNIAPQHRNFLYQTYLIEQQKYFNDRCLYIADEWVAYYNGSLCAKQLNLDDHGSNKNLVHFEHFIDAMWQTIQRQDPNYKDMKALENFIIFQKERTRELLNGPIMPQRYNPLLMPGVKIIPYRSNR